MTKRNKIIYWVATAWLALGMVSTGVAQVLPIEAEANKMGELGYPMYFIAMLGVWKMIGSLVVLLPRLPQLKEWAYAGFFFVMSGALFSHVAVGDDIVECFGPALLLLLTMVSWYLRPSQRRLTPVTPAAG